MKFRIELCTLVLCLVVLSCSKKDEPAPVNNNNGNVWIKSSVTGLAGNVVTAIIIDDNGNKYFGTNKGLSTYNNAKWTSYITSDSIAEHSAINGLSIHKNTTDNSIWIATNHGTSLAIFDVNCNLDSTSAYLKTSVALANDTVTNVVADPNNLKWFCTRGGLSVLGNAWHGNVADLLNFGDSIIISGVFPKTGFNYVGRRSGGMIKFNYSELDGVTGASEWYFPYNGANLDTVRYIFISSTGDLWLACLGNPNFATVKIPKDGLVKHIGDSDPKADYTYFSNVYGGLINNRITYIAESPDHKIWAGSEGGVSYQVNDSTFNNYTVANGLVSSYVTCIAFDMDGSVWIGTKNGVSHLKNGTFSNFKAQ